MGEMIRRPLLNGDKNRFRLLRCLKGTRNRWKVNKGSPAETGGIHRRYRASAFVGVTFVS